MKKSSFPAFRLATLACLFFIFGCVKSGHLPSREDAANFCAIKRISFNPSEGFRDTITFVYDKFGRPIRGDRVNVGTGSPRYVFRYDNQGRLQDFIGAYGSNGSNDGAAEFWTRCAYSADNRTVWDTTYTLVTEFASWPPTHYYGDFSASVRKFDRQGRLIQISFPIPPIVVSPDSVITEEVENFTYDAKGNVEGFAYDDKINYHQTNKVWMFVDDQFSVNNPIPIDAYDFYGLPIKINFNKEEGQGNSVLFGLAYSNTVIEYDCGLSKGD